MKNKGIVFLYLLTTLLITGCGVSKEKRITEDTVKPDSYELVKDWPNLPEDFVLGDPAGLAIDSDNNIVVFHRAGRPWSFPPPEDKISKNTILTIDSETGEILKNWGADFFLMPHGLEIDKENNIWVTDVGLQQIFKFNSDGELLMVLGEAGILGHDSSHFALPTDVTVAPDGSFYASDGYGNSRVMKFSKDGSFLFEWGKNGPDYKLNKGDKVGEFNIPHGIDLDQNGNVYVADRENNRIQKFDAEGNILTVWQNKLTDQLFSVALDLKNDHLFAIDYLNENDSITEGSDIFRFDLDLNLQVQFGRTTSYNGPIAKYHDIVIDDEGSIYVGDVQGNKIHKFRLKKSE
ncbi:peptidyl-alpha-hydroxyglycine alpha-amidating lyase family protein [Maribacter arcticus]|uniref:peptidyl-alpha-hydroxyglycine alpha-amidating lyase family protein n=1 Tax=Maribacter arcticus TaxID=561365 RepID=UPI00300222DB